MNNLYYKNSILGNDKIDDTKMIQYFENRNEVH